MQQTPTTDDKTEATKTQPEMAAKLSQTAELGEPARPAEQATPGEPAKIISMAMARNRRSERNRPRPELPELQDLDLRGVDLDRMTPEAREHYWFNVNKYARHLYVASCDLSMTECNHPYSPICVHHVRDAELTRMGMGPGRGAGKHFGLQFALDALQILGAAVCGALATKPNMIDGMGPIPLASALTMTVLIFLARETLAARS